MLRALLVSLVLIFPASASAQDIVPPKVNDDALAATLFAAEPLIQTPIGMAFDAAGRLLIIESHTHFRPKDWKGPSHDQIVCLQDTDGDGKADLRTVFFDESDMTMDIAAHPDGSIYLSTRNEILRLRDTDNDGRADKIERKLVWMESESRYPHNGLSGLAFDKNGNLYFGMGENLGGSYTLQGTDSTKLSDQGEGGNIFWCDKNGKRLRRIATGFWNPFGVCVDPFGNVFCTDNDPDSRPPCRLHHIIEGGDYGYQFRYGRSGLHPFISWNGELTGTLPMLAGTGEAPCDVICYAPPATPLFAGLSTAWHGSLLVASWVDHRIESYSLKPEGGTFNATRKLLCEGGQDFRPVAFATASDGALFVSDWVRRDYELHGKGRVWRIAAKSPAPLAAAPLKPYPKSSDAALLERIQTGPTPTDAEIKQWLLNPKPYLYAAAIRRLSREGQQLRDFVSISWPVPRLTCGLLLAARQAITFEGLEERGLLPVVAHTLINRAMSDPDSQVALLAMKWISDDQLTRYKHLVEERLKAPAITAPLYYAAMTTLARLDNPKATEADLVKRLKSEIAEPSGRPALKRLALEILPDRDRHITAKDLSPLLEKAAETYKTWLIHYLGTLRDPERLPLLHTSAFDSNEAPPVRVAALLHCDLTDADMPALVEMIMSAEAEPTLARAAAQAIQGKSLSAAQLEGLKRATSPVVQQAVARALGQTFTGPRPPLNKPEDWPKYLAKLPGKPDLVNGRNVFLSPKLGGCALCHRVESIGNNAGPNLSTIGRANGPNYILESLLQPNRNVSPQFESFIITTTDGQTRNAFQLMERGGTHTYIDLGGHTFEIKIEDIVSRIHLPVSIMPEGLVTKLTDDEVRDLEAYLKSLARD